MVSSHTVLSGPLFNLVSSYQKTELKAIALFKDLQNKHLFLWLICKHEDNDCDHQSDRWSVLSVVSSHATRHASVLWNSLHKFWSEFCLNILALNVIEFSLKTATFFHLRPYQFIIARWTKLRFAMVPFTVFLEPFSECMLAGALASLSSYILFRFPSLSRYWITPC